MSDTADSAGSRDRPTFRGCVVCYSAEWAYYGAKQVVKSVSGSETERVDGS